jgi:hypothetical protein
MASCRGGFEAFVMTLSIGNLRAFACQDFVPADDVRHAAPAVSSIDELRLIGDYKSAKVLFQFVKNCRSLRNIDYETTSDPAATACLSRYVLNAISGLTDLKKIKLRCRIDATNDGPIPSLDYSTIDPKLFSGLTSLIVGPCKINILAILQRLRFLKELEFASSTEILLTTDVLVWYQRKVEVLVVDWTCDGVFTISSDDLFCAMRLDPTNMSRARASLLARLVGSTLASLHIDFVRDAAKSGHLAEFFESCLRIEDLKLESLNLDAIEITPIIERVFSVLRSLALSFCSGDLAKFLLAIKIESLDAFSSEDFETANAVCYAAYAFPKIKSLRLIGEF